MRGHTAHSPPAAGQRHSKYPAHLLVPELLHSFAAFAVQTHPSQLCFSHHSRGRNQAAAADPVGEPSSRDFRSLVPLPTRCAVGGAAGVAAVNCRLGVDDARARDGAVLVRR